MAPDSRSVCPSSSQPVDSGGRENSGWSESTENICPHPRPLGRREDCLVAKAKETSPIPPRGPRPNGPAYEDPAAARKKVQRVPNPQRTVDGPESSYSDRTRNLPGGSTIGDCAHR
ncbi:hypothetical protein B2J93_1965 [Marssonina coronariae]|uniref:Uncharacterized protein n=1 Tax=Diplocarpon coronariae TaxID=2795749 RepID=A0A218ZHG3_9HELO|nr:hypothetical protein B2J93_1965 [Marssonina coronariae]